MDKMHPHTVFQKCVCVGGGEGEGVKLNLLRKNALDDVKENLNGITSLPPQK